MRLTKQAFLVFGCFWTSLGGGSADGTLPLGANAELPIRLEGQLNREDASLEGQLKFSKLGNDNSLEEGICPSASVRASAAGSLTFNGTTYKVRGVCYQDSSRNLDVIVRQNGKEFTMRGKLQNNPSTTNFRGSITMERQRYRFDLRSINAIDQ